ncbi:MAG: hypothetical protein CMM95_01300 [Rickettsiales bacterium]|nr:hypothetical protein [Rickettsiales bacterium]
MNKFFFFFILFVTSPIFSSEIKLSSIIILENNIPKECGVKIDINDESILFSVKVTIKKNKNNTSTYFSVNSNQNINYSDIDTEEEKLSKIIKSKNLNSEYYEIESETDQNKTTKFFQELIIGGGKVFINDKKYEISGPIDSKVRLEYLFCTGEMFLPNYKSNK